MRIEFGFDRLPIEMPCGMAKQGDDDGKAKEERARRSLTGKSPAV